MGAFGPLWSIMTRTQISGSQILDGGIQREDINIDKPGNALITKAIAGDNIVLSSTGVDAGTGDVTIGLDTTGASEGEVLTYSGGSASFQSPAEEFNNVSVQTTDGIETNAIVVTIPDNTMGMFTVIVAARGPSNKHYWARIDAGARRNVSESAVLVGSPLIFSDNENSAGYLADVDVNGQDFRVRVTGAASETVDWDVKLLKTF